MQTVEELDDVAASKKAVPVKQTPQVIEIETEEEKPTIDEKAWNEVNTNPEPENIEPERDIEDLRGEIREFISTRPQAWFEKIGKDKMVMLDMIETEKNHDKMVAIIAKTVQYDKLASI
jgi:hypothetical protein